MILGRFYLGEIVYDSKEILLISRFCVDFGDLGQLIAGRFYVMKVSEDCD